VWSDYKTGLLLFEEFWKTISRDWEQDEGSILTKTRPEKTRTEKTRTEKRGTRSFCELRVRGGKGQRRKEKKGRRIHYRRPVNAA